VKVEFSLQMTILNLFSFSSQFKSRAVATVCQPFFVMCRSSLPNLPVNQISFIAVSSTNLNLNYLCAGRDENRMVGICLSQFLPSTRDSHLVMRV
jgi:hypothetical protein